MHSLEVSTNSQSLEKSHSGDHIAQDELTDLGVRSRTEESNSNPGILPHAFPAITPLDNNKHFLETKLKALEISKLNTIAKVTMKFDMDIDAVKRVLSLI